MIVAAMLTITLLLISVIVFTLLPSITANVFPTKVEESHHLPTHIPYYPVRKDTYTGEPVSRNQLPLIGLSYDTLILPDNTVQRRKRVTFEHLHKSLQCAPIEPELDGKRGIWSLLKLAGPPTRNTIELLAAWCETRCAPWVHCREIAAKCKNGAYEHNNNIIPDQFGLFRDPYLIRIINNTIYYDWPWGIERINKESAAQLNRENMAIIHMVIRTVLDIGDSVFLRGGERYSLPARFPFPCLSDAPAFDSSDIPLPWFESYDSEFQWYKNTYGTTKLENTTLSSSNNNNAASTSGHTDRRTARTVRGAKTAKQGNKKSQSSKRKRNSTITSARSKSNVSNMHTTSWHQRLNKAAFFGSWQPGRQVVFDCAALRPDLVDVSNATSAVVVVVAIVYIAGSCYLSCWLHLFFKMN